MVEFGWKWDHGADAEARCDYSNKMGLGAFDRRNGPDQCQLVQWGLLHNLDGLQNLDLQFNRVCYSSHAKQSFHARPWHRGAVLLLRQMQRLE